MLVVRVQGVAVFKEFVEGLEAGQRADVRAKAKRHVKKSVAEAVDFMADPILGF